jgi:hypothetical protein
VVSSYHGSATPPPTNRILVPSSNAVAMTQRKLRLLGRSWHSQERDSGRLPSTGCRVCSSAAPRGPDVTVRANKGWLGPAFLVGTLLTLALGCTSGGSSQTARIALSPVSLVVTAGAGPTTFSATLTGSPDTIVWSLVGPGSFSPSTGATTSYMPPVGVQSPGTATLSAASGVGLSASATITVNPRPPITVAGRVRFIGGLFDGVPNVSVFIGPRTTTTDADGNFAIAGVTPPYDVTVVSGDLATIYQGLTRPDPSIYFFGYFGSGPNPVISSGSVTGDLTGGDVAGTPGDSNSVVWVSSQPNNVASPVAFEDNTFTLNLDWGGATPLSLTLHGLQQGPDPVTGLPSFRGYGLRSNVSVADSATTTNQDIPLAPVTPASVSGSISWPTSDSLLSRTLWLDFADGASLKLLTDFGESSTFNYSTPAGIGATVSIGVSTSGSSSDNFSFGTTAFARGLSPDATGVSLTVPEAAVPISPSDNTAAIPMSTPFTWTPFQGGIHLVIFSGNYSVWLLTAATTTQFPDLSAHGVTVAPNGWTWQVQGLGPFLSTDDFAGLANFNPTSDAVDSCNAYPRSFSFQ